MKRGEGAAGAEAERRDPLRIPTELGDVVFDPLESGSLVAHAGVERLLVLQERQSREAEYREPVVEYDMDDGLPELD